jgi:membrane-associated phospholipid phosphatase
MQDSILFWNAVALEANRVSHSDPDKRQQNGPTLSSRAIAIVHLAMYDAYAGIIGGAAFPRYLSAPSPPSPAPPVDTARDAVAGAAHRTLSRLYSAQADFFDAQLSCFNTNNPSFLFGQAVGQALLNLRANDMDGRDCGYMPSPKRGRHRRDPDNPSQGFHAAFYGAQTRTFAVSQRHTLNPPPFGNGTAQKYLRALRDVRARGIRPELTATLPTTALFNRRRTPADTLVGIYWGYDGANRLGTPPRLYNQIIRQVAMNVFNPRLGRIHNEGDNARLFAFVNAAMGDAGILAWEQKYCHDFWRPVVGIREHDRAFGPAAPHTVNTDFDDGDPGWLPLGAPSTNSTGMKNFTPDFPAYPSGHATFGAAAFHITRMFYGRPANDKSDDDLFKGGNGRDLFFVSDEYNGGNRDNDGTVRPRHTRFFPDGLWQMIIENALSRVFLGVHWIFDAFDFTGGDNSTPNPSLNNENIGGVGLGLRIARDVFAHGSNGQGPQMTPNNVVPPIITPPAAPSQPMPSRPAQPAEVGGCAGPAVDQPQAQSATAKSSKKGAAKGSAKKGGAKKGSAKKAAAKGAEAEAAEQEQEQWPSGISEQDEAPPAVQGSWPSGISEK